MSPGASWALRPKLQKVTFLGEPLGDTTSSLAEDTITSKGFCLVVFQYL